MSRIWIQHAMILSMDGSPPFVGDVLVNDGEVAYAGPSVREGPEGGPMQAGGWGRAGASSGWRRIDGEGRLLMPGFVNAHTHSAMSVFRGLTGDPPLLTWLKERVWPLERRLTGEAVYWGTLLAACEMIRNGITCVADMYFFMDDAARAIAESGLRASLCRGVRELDGSGNAGLAEALRSCERWGPLSGGRITAMLGPHSAYTCSPGFLGRVSHEAAARGLPVHIHVSESRWEVEESLARHGQRPVALLESVGLLDGKATLVHCVDVDEREREVIRRTGARVVHCPGSNLKLGCGVAPVPEFLELGIPVALGTDGPASNDNLDLLEEVRLAALLHGGPVGHRMRTRARGVDETGIDQADEAVQVPGRVGGGPDGGAVPEKPISAYVALQMGTTGGCRALWLDESTGTVAKGMRADLILIDMSGAHWAPHVPAVPQSVILKLVYSARSADVSTVIVDGEVLMENQRLLCLDEETIKREASSCARRLIGCWE